MGKKDCLVRKFITSLLAVVLWWGMLPVFPALAGQSGDGQTISAAPEPLADNSIAQDVYGIDTPTVQDIPPIYDDQESALIPPEIITPPLLRDARATGVIQVAPFRTIDEIVQKAKELPNTAFNSSKITQYATMPSFTPPYAAGSLTTDDLNDALNTIKMVRYLAGLPYSNITLADRLNSAAQAKAVLLAVSNFDHYPAIPADMDGAFYNLAQSTLTQSTNGGAECIGAGYANLSRSILVQFVGDSGDNNIAQAGHRMIMFHPGTVNFGAGYAYKPGANYSGYRTVVQSEYPSSNIDSYVAWPSAGDFPMQYFTGVTNLTSTPVYPWSLSLGADYQRPTKSNITLTLTRSRDNKTWTFNSATPDLSVSGYNTSTLDHLSVNGQNIIFRPNAAALGPIREGDIFNVALSGIKTSAGIATTLQYNINFFDLTKEMNRSQVNITVKCGSTPIQGATVTIDGQTLTTDVNGLATLRVNNNSSYSYTVTAPGYETDETATGSVSVGSNSVSKDVPVYIPVNFTISNTNTTYNGTAQGVTVVASPSAAYSVTYNGSATVPKNAGTYNVLVQANAPGYTGSGRATLIINKAVLQVSAANQSITYGDTLPDWTLTYAGFVNGEEQNILTTRPTVALATAGKLNAGNYTLIVSGGAAGNYDFRYTNGTLRVIPKDVTVSGLSVFDKEYQAGDVSATIEDYGYVINGMVVGDNLSIDPAALTAQFTDDAIGSNKNVTISGITLTGSDKNNYHLTSTTATATANIKAALTAQDIADTITSVPLLPRDATLLQMPVIPPGFTISIGASDNAAINTNGSVAPVDADTNVHLVFQVTKTSDRTTANTAGLTVTVPASTKYTINVTAGDGGSISGSGRYNKNAYVFLTATPDTGYSFDGWYENNVKIAGAGAQYSFPATIDRTLQARFTANSGGSPAPGSSGGGGGGGGGGGTPSYTVTFATDGGSSVASQSLGAGGKVTKPADPAKDGFTFAGWYADQKLTTTYDFNKAVTGSITIYAGWTENTTTPAAAPIQSPTPVADTNSEWQNPFSDVDSGDWFYNDVRYAATKGIFKGASATTFAPHEPMTRAMFVTALWRLAGSPAGSSNSFGDVEQNTYYAPAVQWAAANNIAQGISNNLFAPNTAVTREQVAVMLSRYEQLIGSTMPNAAAGKEFADASKISDYAKNPVHALTQQGILSGKPDNLIDPQGAATRAEAAAILHRYYDGGAR